MPFTKEYWEQKRIEKGLTGEKMPAGRHLGTKSKLTLLKEKTMDRVDKSVALMAQKIVNAQAIVALGNHKMIRMFKDSEGKPHVETIRDEKRMQNLLDTGEYGVDYVIVVGEMPEWKAGQSILDRTFGKAKETVKHEGEVTFSLKSLKQARDTLQEDSIDITDDEASSNLLEDDNGQI